MSDNRLSNLGKDLTKAKQQALLIEVLQSDLESWVDQSPDVFRTVCDASAAVFDANVKGGKTNVLMVGEADGQQPASIFGALLGSLDNEFDDLHKREILAKLAGFGLNQALGGVVGDAVGDNLNVGAEKMMDYLAEWRGSAPDFLTSFFEAGVEAVADESGEIVGAIGGTGAEAIAGQFSSKDSIYLSRAARKRLKELAPRLSEEATSHETLQLALEMLLVTAQGAPKVIVVKDPLRLDDASLALLAMLVSQEKDLRQVNHTEEPEPGRAQTAGTSVVLTFTGTQPHETFEAKDTAEKQRAISRLRMMASRYSLLERLDSDIPVPAVRASTFVGREAELKSLWQDWNTLCKQPGAEKQTWALIKGEPGTGKTALANRFIQRIRSDTNNPACQSIPTLRMLNQTGHSAQATGLASLKNSIADELRRLNLIYQENVGWFNRFGQQVTEDAQRWTKDARSDDPEAKKRTRGRIGKMISRLVGVDAAVEVASSAKAWSKQDEMRSMREQEFGQSSRADHKEEQYELLRAALNEIRALARKCTSDQEGQPSENTHPLLLLIDDLQWVDDFTAEFLLNEWPADMPVYIIATARGSDSFTTTGDSSRHQAMNHHRNRLFSELGLIDPAPTSPEQESGEERVQGKEKDDENKAHLSLASNIDLKGMNQSMLANLIKLTYAGIAQEQAEQFAVVIIKNLSGENNASDVITLFATETLNVISDPQFYRRNPKLPRLIEPLPGTDRYRFGELDNMGLPEAMDKVFKNLTSTYQASYLVESGQSPGGARFNLASYAVLEERLHLIEQYFGEYGGTARYSLLFSALLGSPFQSDLVRHVLGDLQDLSPVEHPDLTPFLKELQKQVHGNLQPAQYELMERAYEIIRRLEENTSRYVHQHNLLQHFLLGQFTQLLELTYPEPKAMKEGIRNLVSRIKTSGSEWFSVELEKQAEGLPCEMAIELERLQFLTALTGYWYRLMQKRTPEIGEWVGDYSGSLTELALAYRNMGRSEDALPLNESALSIFREAYQSYPQRCSGFYSGLLNLLADSYKIVGRPEDAVPLDEEALAICREAYELEPQSWSEAYVNGLNALAESYNLVGRPEEARPLFEESLSCIRGCYESDPMQYAAAYITSLNGLASICKQIRHVQDALPFYEEALSISRQGYESTPEQWSLVYADSLDNFASTYTRLGREKEALPLVEEALLILHQSYAISPLSCANSYVSSLNHAANIYLEEARYFDALPLFEKALSIARDGYEATPQRWAMLYSKCLFQVAYVYSQDVDLMKNALQLAEESLAIRREGYASAPERWALGYVAILKWLSRIYKRMGRKNDGELLSEEARSSSSGELGKSSSVDTAGRPIRKATVSEFRNSIHQSNAFENLAGKGLAHEDLDKMVDIYSQGDMTTEQMIEEFLNEFILKRKK